MRARAEKMQAPVCCAPGSWGAGWYGVAPAAGEAVVTKHCYSGFAGTDLDAQLRARGIRYLVFAGVQTHVCVESTLRDAHSHGYFCTIAEDCVASHTPAAHQQTLANVRFLFGDVAPAAQITASWN
jgi:ureidoacrylate peracid hydrolase